MTMPLFTPEQRNGRQILVLALTLLGAIPLWTLFIQGSSPVMIGGVMLVYCAVFFFTCQGGQVALGLLKGVSVLMGLVFTILLIALALIYFGVGKLPPGGVQRNPLEIVLPALITYFAIWSLFFSRLVKCFLAGQRERQRSEP